jgi:hypothetical protein
VDLLENQCIDSNSLLNPQGHYYAVLLSFNRNIVKNTLTKHPLTGPHEDFN